VFIVAKYLICKQSPLIPVQVCDGNRRKFVNPETDK